MTETKDNLAGEVQWIDPSGQRMLLAASHGGKLRVTIESGAVEIQGTQCLLTQFAMPGTAPEVKVTKAYCYFTISLVNCRIDWNGL
jgi:hypothetical protein